MKGFKDIKQLMKREGFEYIGKNGGDHPVWSDGNITLATSGTTGDCRTVRAIRSQIRRARRAAG